MTVFVFVIVIVIVKGPLLLAVFVGTQSSRVGFVPFLSQSISGDGGAKRLRPSLGDVGHDQRQGGGDDGFAHVEVIELEQDSILTARLDSKNSFGSVYMIGPILDHTVSHRLVDKPNWLFVVTFLRLVVTVAVDLADGGLVVMRGALLLLRVHIISVLFCPQLLDAGRGIFAEFILGMFLLEGHRLWLLLLDARARE